MISDLIALHKRANHLQTIMLLLGSGLVMGLAGLAFGGISTMILLFIAGGVILWFVPKVSANTILRLYKAQPLAKESAPQLFQTLEVLAQRAGLPGTPSLHYVPSHAPNAFAVSQHGENAVAVTDGLLRRLSPREITGVLAHEISHIKNNDMRVMSMADVLSRLTHSFASVGWIMLLFNLPLILMGGSGISLFGIVSLILAPQLTALMQLALSRTREYDADLGAVELTGDPEGLASALRRLDYQPQSLFQRLISPNRNNTEPSLLRTHPPVEERIARLNTFSGNTALQTTKNDAENNNNIEDLLKILSRPSHPPHKRLISGLWY